MSVDALDRRLPMGAIVSHQDISARKKAELALAESEQRYRAVFDLAAVGMAEISADGRWLRANSALLRIAGRTREDLMSKTVRDITHAQDIDADAAYLEVLHAGGAEFLRDGEAADQAGRRFGLDGDRAVVRAPRRWRGRLPHCGGQ